MTVLNEFGHDISGTTAQRPTNCEPGCRYFDTDIGQVLVWNGTTWNPPGMITSEVTFTETAGAGTYTGSVPIPAGATIHDIVVNGVALWTAGTSATMKVGDAATDNGYFTGVNLKATDLLAGESISFDQAGGKAGSYIANNQVSPRYSATARVISGIVVTVGTGGTAGRTRMTVVYSLPSKIGTATKA